MQTYREVFALREFRAIFAGQLVSAATLTVQTLAFAVLVYTRTGSPLLSAVAFLAGSLPQAAGALTLSGFCDRRPPRSVLVLSDGVRALTIALLASGVLSVAEMLGCVALSGVAFGALGGARVALVARIIPLDAYALGRSALNVASSGMQVIGYAAGGALLGTVGARWSLWTAAAVSAAACAVDRFGLSAHPAGRDRHSSLGDTWRTSRRILTDTRTGRLMLSQWVPNGLIVGAEALFIPYTRQHAALLFTGAATGLLAGDLVAGRLIAADRRAAAAGLLYALLGLPYLAFAVRPSPWLATALVTVASLGFGGTLCVQQSLVQAVAPERLGQVFALSAAGMLTTQGLAAYMAGAVAELIGPGPAMTVMAVMSLGATLVLLSPETAARVRRHLEPIPDPKECQ